MKLSYNSEGIRVENLRGWPLLKNSHSQTIKNSGEILTIRTTNCKAILVRTSCIISTCRLRQKMPTDLQIPVSPSEPGFRLSFNVPSNPQKRNLATSRLVSFTCESAPAFLFTPVLWSSKYMEGFTLILPSSFLWYLSLHCTNLRFPSYDSKWCNWNTYQQINQYLFTLKAYKVGMFCVFFKLKYSIRSTDSIFKTWQGVQGSKKPISISHTVICRHWSSCVSPILWLYY